jgi:hypothetical protein
MEAHDDTENDPSFEHPKLTREQEQQVSADFAEYKRIFERCNGDKGIMGLYILRLWLKKIARGKTHPYFSHRQVTEIIAEAQVLLESDVFKVIPSDDQKES